MGANHYPKAKNKKTIIAPITRKEMSCDDCAYYSSLPEGAVKYTESLGARVLVGILSLLIVGITVESGIAYFSALFVYSAPFLFETIRVAPSEKVRRALRKGIGLFAWMNLGISLLGLFNFFVLSVRAKILFVSISSKFLIPLDISVRLWIIYLFVCMPMLALTVIDMAVNQSKTEKNVLKRKYTFD